MDRGRGGLPGNSRLFDDLKMDECLRSSILGPNRKKHHTFKRMTDIKQVWSGT